VKTIVKIDPLLNFEDLEENLKLPVVIRVNDFDDENVNQFEEEMSEAHQTGQPIIPIVIHSGGGNVYGLLSMMSAIDHSKLPVATILAGTAMSAAAVLFAYGDIGHRYMDPHAYIMLHEAWEEANGKVEDLKADVKHLERLNSRVYKRLAQHIGFKEEDHLLKLLHKKRRVDHYLDAEEAKRHHLTDHLYIPSFNVEVKVIQKFGL
jgi:ATP-dependent Clp protease protease subunit